MSGQALRDPVLPSGRFWIAVLGLYPVATAALAGLVAASYDGHTAVPVLGVLGVLVAAAILRDRQVHLMPVGWQVWWLAVGIAGWAAAAAAFAFAAFAVIVLVACSGTACFS